MAPPPVIWFYAGYLYESSIVLTSENHRTSMARIDTDQAGNLVFPKQPSPEFWRR